MFNISQGTQIELSIGVILGISTMAGKKITQLTYLLNVVNMLMNK